MAEEQKKKQEILDAAALLFQKFGLNKTTMNDISKHLNIGKATLYYYFKNKQELLYIPLIINNEYILVLYT